MSRRSIDPPIPVDDARTAHAGARSRVPVRNAARGTHARSRGPHIVYQPEQAGLKFPQEPNTNDPAELREHCKRHLAHTQPDMFD